MGLGGKKCKSLENLPNGWTDWHQIWYTSADSSGNGHRLKQLALRYTRGHWGGGRVRGQKLKSPENLPNGWTDWHQIWYTSADSHGNGQTVPRDPGEGGGGSFWGLGGQNVIKSLRNAMICREKMKINYIKMKCTKYT